MNFVCKNLYLPLIFLAPTLLAGCSVGGGNNENAGDTNTASITMTTDAEIETIHSGSVGDGPIVASTIVVKDKNGIELERVSADAYANYKVLVKARGNAYPLLIESIGGTDLVTNDAPTFRLLSVALRPSDKIININPFTTLIVNTAQAMGGLSEENVLQATANVLRELNFGFNSTLMEDPLFYEVDKENVASVVKSSETLAELIRRTQDAFTVNGDQSSEDEIVVALAADLVDGELNGKGSAAASHEVALWSRVISGALILEALPNRLYVNGVEATSAMDSSILTIMPDASPVPVTGDVASTEAMVLQLQAAIDLAQRIAPADALTEISALLDQLSNIEPETAVALLPGDAHTRLDQSLTRITSLTEDEIIALNISQPSPANTPPLISGTAITSVAEGENYYFSPVSSDTDGDSLSFAITNKPAWLAFDGGTGVISGSPGYNDAGNYSDITISVSDGEDSVALSPFAITVTNTNRAPSISGVPVGIAAVGESYQFTPTASDLDGDLLSYSIVNRPEWAQFDSATGVLSGIPTNADIGQQSNIRITVSDGEQAATLPTFSITVILTNQPPVISGVPSTTVAEGAGYSFIPTATDSDGNSLVFSIINKPQWANFNSSTGALSGSLGYFDSGLYSGISISVSDGYESVSLPSFAIAVSNVNRAPAISGTPVLIVSEGSAYSFTPTVNDPDNDPLTFSVVNRPAWMTFNSSTGRLSGTPDYSDSAQYGNIAISVNDGVESVALPPFSLEVLNVNRAPIISGNPVLTVTEGETYSFMPSASDPDDDPMSFSIVNRPAWANFNSTTGELSGVPGSGDAGSYNNIVISVDDGDLSSSLVSYTIDVSPLVQQVSGSATLSWVAPTLRVDGRVISLSEIGGFRIYYGYEEDALAMILDIDDPTATQHIIDGLSPGTHYFAVSAYDSNGAESDLTQVKSKVIQN